MPHDLQVRLGAAIKAQRRRLGVTQEELAWRANLHRTYLADIERGSRNVTLRSVANLAEALEMPIERLFDDLSGAAKSRPDRVLGEVLLVEADNENVERTLRSFKKSNLSNPVKAVNSGREALDYLLCRGRYAGRHPVAPQLVLLDLNLPDMRGRDVLKQLRSNRKTTHIPVIALAASPHDQGIAECARFGVEDHLIKPVEFEGFSRLAPKIDLHWALVKATGARRRTSPSRS